MKRSLTFQYSVHQIAYWGAAAGVMSFATAFLLEKGFPAGQVGTLMACGSILSCITQPLLASLADRSRTSALKRFLILLSGTCTMCFGLLLLPGLPAGLFAMLYLCGVWFFDAMLPLMNSVCVYYTRMGWHLNFGVARGIGSLSYSLAALALGYIIQSLGSDWMIRVVLILLPLCIAVVLTYPKALEEAPTGEKEKSVPVQAPCSPVEFLFRYRWYCCSLIGILLLGMFHAMTENYLIAIMERLGGGSSHVGVALFIATAAEAVILMFLDPIRKRISDHWLLRIAGFSFLIKSVLFLTAPNIPFIYAAQLLQMTSYAFLSPIQVYYANEKVAPQDMVKGQAFITASYTLGCATGNFAGGQLMQHFGILAILISGVAIAAAGTLVLLLTLERKDEWLAQHTVS